MICLRCGHCCHVPWVMIVDDPEKEPGPLNCQWHLGKGPCKHLRGSKPGEYSCTVHDKPWYHGSSCAKHNVECVDDSGVCVKGKQVMDLYAREEKKDVYGFEDFKRWCNLTQ